MNCSVTLAAGDVIDPGRFCSCGHAEIIHAKREGSVECDVCALLGNVVGPDDYLIIRSDRMTDEAAYLMRRNIVENLPGLVGRVLIVEAERADVYVSRPGDVGKVVSQSTFNFGTYPGHDPQVTIGACRPSHPCPACVQRLHGRPPTSESGVSAGPDGRR